jgi:hypothetical protein
MTRLFYDCEFIDDGRTIDLISIGMVSDTGAEYYAVSSEFGFAAFARNQWLVDNVWPSLPRIGGDARNHIPTRTLLGRPRPQHKLLRDLFDYSAREVKSRTVIAAQVYDFVASFPQPQLWAWYGAYDHVALAQLWGPMVKLPRGVPMFTNDLKQEAVRLGNPDVPKQLAGEHNALADARHNRVVAHFLDDLAARRP